MGSNRLQKFEYHDATFHPALSWIIPLAFLLVGFWGYGSEAIDYFRAVPGDMGDARYNSIILEHVYQWAIGKEPSLWSPRFFFPFERILFFSDTHLGSVIFYIPIRLLGFEREVAFDVWFLISLCLNFSSSLLSLRLLRLSILAASVGAFIFTFSLPVLHLELHAQLFFRFQIPLAFYFFLRYLRTRDAASFAWTIFWIVWLFFSSIYLGVFLCYFLSAVFVVWIFIGEPKTLFGDTVKSIVSFDKSKSILVSTLLLGFVGAFGWLLYQYLAVMKEYHLSQPKWQLLAFLPRLGGYFEPGDRLFFGYMVLFLFLMGAAISVFGRTQRQLSRISFIALIIIFVITASTNGKSLYALLAPIPGVGTIRAVSRIVLVMAMPVGILAAICIEPIVLMIGRRYRHMKLYLLLSILLMSLGAEVIAYSPLNTPREVWKKRKSIVHQRLPGIISSDSILMVQITPGEEYYQAELDGMMVAQDLHIATLNGYAGFVTPGYTSASPCYAALNRLIAYAEFRKQPFAEMSKWANKIIVVSSEPCDHEPAVGFFGTIRPEQASSLVLKVLAMNGTAEGVRTTIQITNQFGQDFRTFSLSGNPILLSWRLVPLSETGQRLSEPAWANRVELGWRLQPDQSHVLEVLIPWPESTMDQLLEVSLVQEGISWLHDLGMRIAQSRFSPMQLKPK